MANREPILFAVSKALQWPVEIRPRKITKHERLEKKLQNLQERLRKRIQRGRTRGAGAGGFNRDINNISHQIKLVKNDLENIDGSGIALPSIPTLLEMQDKPFTQLSESELDILEYFRDQRDKYQFRVKMLCDVNVIDLKNATTESDLWEVFMRPNNRVRVELIQPGS